MTDQIPQCGASDQRNVDYQKNFDVQKYYDFLVGAPEPIIFDVGAHRGESVSFFKALFPAAALHSFEPEPSNFAALSEVAAIAGVEAHQIALSDRKGVGRFFSQDISHMSGLRPIDAGSEDSLGYAARASNTQIEVALQTIDGFCQERKIGRIDLLKIDVQGHEIEVLRGAKEMLRHTRCVQVEVSLFDLYGRRRSPLFHVETIFHGAGFSLWDIAKISKNPRNFRTDWFEAVYLRDPE